MLTLVVVTVVAVVAAVALGCLLSWWVLRPQDAADPNGLATHASGAVSRRSSR